MHVSTPEATAIELVGYAKNAGGLDNVATVLADLAESLDADRLVAQAREAPLAWAQRLGYLLELIEAGEVAPALLLYVQEHARRVAPLDPSVARTGAKRSERWRLAINATVEVDR
jgi:predicted transcriptional regulator of viral defense system